MLRSDCDSSGSRGLSCCCPAGECTLLSDFSMCTPPCCFCLTVAQQNVTVGATELSYIDDHDCRMPEVV